MADGTQVLKIIDDMNLGAGSVFIDAGAQTGQELHYLANTDIEVHSFECHPEHFKQLNKVYGGCRNIELYHACVYIHDEMIPVYFKHGDSMGSMSLCEAKINVNERDGIMVRSIDICNFVSSLGRHVDVLKLDVEGAEFDIIEKLITSHKINNISRIYFEDHLHKFHDHAWHQKREKVLEMMTAFPNSKFGVWY
tara:strand:+ start:3139 stop:3720 length:582 start_codon:yes stop_codon:yes gene_type:complete